MLSDRHSNAAPWTLRVDEILFRGHPMFGWSHFAVFGHVWVLPHEAQAQGYAEEAQMLAVKM